MAPFTFLNNNPVIASNFLVMPKDVDPPRGSPQEHSITAERGPVSILNMDRTILHVDGSSHVGIAQSCGLLRAS